MGQILNYNIVCTALFSNEIISHKSEKPYTQVSDKKGFISDSALVSQVSYMANIIRVGYYKEPYKHC
jgi:hypothetical protein